MKALCLTYSYTDAMRAVEVGRNLNGIDLHVLISPPNEQGWLGHAMGGIRALPALLRNLGLAEFLHLFVSRNPWRVRNPWKVVGGLHDCEVGNRDRAARLRAEGILHVIRWPLGDGRTLDWIRRRGYDVGLYMWGAIVRRPLIEAFRRGVLNAHIGLLPFYRGRSVMEWSLFHGDATGVTVFFLDEGIDTGPELVLRVEESVGGFRGVDAAKRHLFDRDVDMFRMALASLQNSTYVPMRQEAGEGRRFYVMSGLLRGVVEAELTTR